MHDYKVHRKPNPDTLDETLPMVKAGFHYEITQDGTTALRNLEKLSNGQAVSNIKEYPRTAVFDVVQYWKEK